MPPCFQRRSKRCERFLDLPSCRPKPKYWMLGAAQAMMLARHGAQVLLADINAAGAAATAICSSRLGCSLARNEAAPRSASKRGRQYSTRIAEIAPSWMPIEAKLAKPHNAYAASRHGRKQEQAIDPAVLSTY